MDSSTTDLCVVPVPQSKDVLTEVLRHGAQRLLAEAIEAEVAGWIDSHSHLRQLNGTPQPARQTAELIETLSQAVHVAHQAGIIHRDLKPGNILLAVSSEQWAASQRWPNPCYPLLTAHCPLFQRSPTSACVAFRPDGKRLASCGDDCTLKLWDTQ